MEEAGDSLPPVATLTRTEDIQRALAAVSAREHELDAQLGAVLAQQGQLTSRMALVRKAIPAVTSGQREARKVAGRVEDTATLAESVSGRVRELNTALERIDATVLKVAEILNLKYCVEGITAAMDAADYQQAAAYVAEYSKFDEDVLEQTSTDALVAASARLRTEVASAFDAAVAGLDRDAVLRFGKLFVPIGMGDAGVDAYTRYIDGALAHEFAGIWAGLEQTLAGSGADGDGGEAVTFVSALTSLYDVAAFCVESEEAVVADMFGSVDSAWNRVVGAIQAKVDELAGRVLDAFGRVRKLDELAKTVTQASMTGVAAGLPPAKQVDLLLYEIASISNRTEMFDAFLRKAAPDGVAHVSQLNMRVQEMIASYLSLEMYFMNESVTRAISMDETTESSTTSSMIDDVFYVLSKCARRAVSTFSTNSVCAMVNNLAYVLSETLVPLLQAQIAEHGATFFESRTCAVVLNNLDLGASYIPQLRASVASEAADLGFADDDQAKIAMCLDDLSGAVAHFHAVLRDALDNISSSLQPRLKPLTSTLLDVSYELSESEFAANERADPFVSSLISGVSGVVAPYKTVLSPSNYDAFIAGVISYVAKRIEADSRRKVFNQLGALQFDKDIRALMAFFSSLTQRPVRDMMARLTQIATLLNVESLAEVGEYWSSMDWRLKPVEVKRVLRLRRDFAPDAIARLNLPTA